MMDTGRFIETTVKEGDRVVFGKYSGFEIEHHGAPECICMTEDDIVGILEDE
jgi:chaperonin GroES